MAARVYFQKHASELTLPEAALLAGILQNPTAYDPIANPTRARQRRDNVLALMFGQGLITREQYDQASRRHCRAPTRSGSPEPAGPAQYFAEYVKQQLIPYYGSGKVFGGGLKVYTSIDLGAPEARARGDRQVADETRTGPQAALVAIDPRDGRVLAMIGGDELLEEPVQPRRAGRAPARLVVQAVRARGGARAGDLARRRRSQSKPQVISLGDKLWAVHNYENSYLGTADLETATVVSDNTVYAQLTAQLGPKNVVKMAHRLGVQSPLEGFVAIGLGVEAVNPLEMARAFSTFADGGARVDGSLLGNLPRAVLAVDDGKRHGPQRARSSARCSSRTRPRSSPRSSSRSSSEGTGTPRRARRPPVAGKTGTTENYGDAWFVGYTPQLAVAVWVGYPDRLQPMLTEFNGDPSPAAPIRR